MMGRSSGKEDKKALVSSRYAPMYVPNHSWDFFDAFNNSVVSQMAFADNVVSVEGRNLDRYLKLNRKRIIEENENANPKLPPLPPYLTALLVLQEPSGQFSKLDRVMEALSLGSLEFSKIRRYDTYQQWQIATAIAIAVLRQQREYFDRIVDAYDKAKQWLPSEELVQEMRTLLEEAVSQQDNREQTHTMQQRFQYNTTLNGMTHTRQSLAEVPFQETDEVAQLIAHYAEGQRSRTRSVDTETDLQSIDEDAIVARDVEKELNLDRTANLDEYFDIAFTQLQNEALVRTVTQAMSQLESHDDGKGSEDGDGDGDGEKGALEAALAAAAANATANATAAATSQSLSTSTEDVGFTHLRAALQQLEVKVNQQRVDELDAEVTSLGVSLITLALDIESISKKVLHCLQRSVHNYNNSELFVVRYKTFDELTAMLGEGFAGSAAYDDWRREGVPGVRPLMLAFFDALYRLAEKRLLLLEELMPIGLGAKKTFTEEMKRSRWTVVFQGQNLALRVLHSLDFLRKCRELSDWFGPMFYFMANPLMFSFPPSKAYDGLQIGPKVTELFHSTPHARLGIGATDAETGWEQENYLENFRRYFKALSADTAFNWPSVPLLPDKESNAMYFRAIASMFVCCKDSIDSAYSWETKFQGKISSLKGQEDNLIGQNNQRVNKILRIPTLEERKPRFTIMRKIQQQQKRAAQAELSKASEAVDVDGRKDSVFSVVRVSDLKARSTKEKPVKVVMTAPEVVGAAPPPVDEKRAAALSRLMPASEKKGVTIAPIREENEEEAFPVTVIPQEEDEEAMELGELAMRSLDENDGIRELAEGEDGEDGNANLLERLQNEESEGTRSSLLDSTATATSETATTTSSSGGELLQSSTLDSSQVNEDSEEWDGRGKKKPPGKKLTEMGKRRIKHNSVSGPSQSPAAAAAAAATAGQRSPGAKRIGLVPHRKPSSSPSKLSSLSPARKPSSPGEKGIAFRKKKSVMGSTAGGGIEGDDDKTLPLVPNATTISAAESLDEGEDKGSHLSISTTNSNELPKEQSVVEAGEVAGGPAAVYSAAPLSSAATDDAARVGEDGQHTNRKAGSVLYEKKSTYRMSQRISFTGMQRLIRRETEAGSALQLSRIQSLQKSYSKRQTSSMTVMDDIEEPEGGAADRAEGEGKKNRRRANIVKSTPSANAVSDTAQTAPSSPTPAPLPTPSPIRASALKSSLKLPSLASGGGGGRPSSPVAVNGGEGAGTGSAGPEVVKARKTVRIRLSDSGPKALEAVKETSTGASSSGLPSTSGKGKQPRQTRNSIVVPSSSSSSTGFTPSKMLAMASVLSEGSLASSDENDKDTPPRASSAPRPSIIRQRIAQAMNAQGSKTAPGGRDRVSRIALPVLQENVAAGRSIQGIRPSSQGQNRMTKRRPSSTTSEGKSK